MKACLNGNLRDVRNALVAQGEKSGIAVGEIAEVYAEVLALSDQEARSRLEECAG
jgi:hypothetical protein